MRICYVITSLKIGGAEVALTRITAKMQEKGHDVFVAFFHTGPMLQRLIEQGIKPVQITGIASPYDPWGWWQLYCFLAQLKPDVIHASLWSASIMTRVLGPLISVPIISELHGNCTKEGFLRNIIDSLTTNRPAAIVAVSQAVASAYKRMVNKTFNCPILVVPNGIELAALGLSDKPITRAALGIPADAFVVGSIGRLEPIKGYDLLIKAFALLPENCWLVIVGGGSQLAHLKALSKQLGINQRTIFTGFLSDASGYYPILSCFALSSHSEGLSLALLEAMAHGIASVTTHDTGVHDLITQKQTGLLVLSRQPADFATCLSLLVQNPALCQQLGAAGKKHIITHYSLQAQASALETLYQTVIHSAANSKKTR
jgi:glycosyltransferase involved in cell wall biosynthesis